MLADAMRMLCIQATIQLMGVLSGGEPSSSFLSADFVLLVVYVVLGVMMYWLAVRRVIAIV